MCRRRTTKGPCFPVIPLRHTECACNNGDLCPDRCRVTLPKMQSIARLLQFAGLTIPPITIFAQLSNNITASQMLGFLIVSVCLFSLGYFLQRGTSGQ